MNPVEKNNALILDAAAEGALVLTVNKRLSRHLGSLFDARMRQEGRGAWRTPEILSLDAWLRRALVAIGEEPRLLDAFPARRLWEEVIEAETAGSDLGLLQVPATARRAMEAHGLLTEFGVDLSGEPLTEDHEAFLRWRRDYLEACRVGGWLDGAELTDRICAALSSGALPSPERILLAGFDEISPRTQKLCAAFAAGGSLVEEVPPAAEPWGEAVRLPCADAEEEVRLAARWARRLLEEGEENVGIIVPDLQGYRSTIERIFRAEIYPGALPSLEEEAVFSLSLGSPLSEQGLIVAALEILSADFSLPLDRASFLLRSPYLGSSQGEMYGRARLERALRSSGSKELSLSRLDELAVGGDGLPALEGLRGILGKLREGLSDRKSRSPGEWVSRFTALLADVGWPGERPLNSIEYQVVKAWREKLLPQIVSLESVSPSLDRGAALSLLRRLASEIEFQPETPAGPLQVVGILEAAGLNFDHLWVMGLGEEALPAPARPNPFIPVPIQVEGKMPHASAARELDFARKVVGRLLAGAPAIVLSHPCREGDCELRPSPLISAVEAGEVPLADLHAPEAVLRRQPSPLQEILDQQAPPLAQGEKASGGTSILKDQALCPFRAFAHHRLGARALDRPEVGLDAGTRGTLLHAVLERFWGQTGSQENLITLGDEDRELRIESCVAAAFGEAFGENRSAASGALLEIEGRRLAALVTEWLEEVEMKRPPFRIEALEEERTETFGRLTIKTIVDRIDEIAGGSRAILDYKTGRVDLGDLLGERLLEPQLPVYGSGAEVDAAGVAFASVRRGECSIKGVAREADLLPRVEPFAGSKLSEKHGIADWEELLSRWRSRLEELGDEFARGEAAVAPVDAKRACQYCDLSTFCRIDEIAQLQEEEE